MSDRDGIFAGDDPFDLIRAWLAEAQGTEVNDPNAIALATVDAGGMPNARMVLLKDIEDNAFVFYTNYGSAKAQEAEGAGKAAFVMHWKSLRRQVRARGTIEREDGPQADAYFKSRSLRSQFGAYASDQSRPLAARADLLKRVKAAEEKFGASIPRPPFWGGLRLTPLEIEFWADGDDRLHDRFQWTRATAQGAWTVQRLNP